MQRFLLVLLAGTLLNFSALGQPAIPDGFMAQLIFGGLNPVSLVTSPEGLVFVTEKDGKIRVVKDDILLENPLAVIGVDDVGEHGLLGIALDPEFEFNRIMYLYYTVPGQNHNRVSRFHFHPDDMTIENEEVLLDLDPLLGLNHSGGCLKFGPDGKLYIGTGDGSRGQNAQDLTSLLGKILRINPDGSIPTDNPFFLTNEGKSRAIYAYGLRNPFTFSFGSAGRLFANDVGAESYEEINEIFAGKNYGWPLVEGKFSQGATKPDNYMEPIYSYSHDFGCAITGSAFFPQLANDGTDTLSNQYLFGEYCKGNIMMLDPATMETKKFVSNARFPIAIDITKNGEVFFLTFQDGGGQLWKVTTVLDGKPKITVQPKSKIAAAGETVKFWINAVGEAPLQYQWKRNGALMEGAQDSVLTIADLNVQHHGNIYTCEVSNEKGTAESFAATLNVPDRNRPEISFDLTQTRLPYHAGDTIVVKATITDAMQGTLDASAFTWKVDFHHDYHTHPVITEKKGVDSISFIVPRIGETAANVWHRIGLEGINSANLTKYEYKEIFPAKSTIVVETSNDPLTVFLDGKPFDTPLRFTSVTGLTRTLGVEKSQYHLDSIFFFQSWRNSQSSGPSFIFNVPQTDATYHATYRSKFLGNGIGLQGAFYTLDKVFEGSPTYQSIDVIDFDWGVHSPHPTLSVDNFSASWTGYIRAPETGLYNFHILCDDGAELTIGNDVLVSDLAYGHPPIEFTAQKQLVAEEIYPIIIKYFEATGGATLKFYWSSDKISKSIVPRSALYPEYPAPEITLVDYPQDAFMLNQTLRYSAEARDYGNRDLSADSFTWEIAIIKGPGKAKQILMQKSGSKDILFAVPDTIAFADPIHLEARLIVVDQNGFSDTLTTVTKAQFANFSINSENSSAEVRLDGKTVTLPYHATTIAGKKMSLAIPEKHRLRISNDTLFYTNPSWLQAIAELAVTADTAIWVKYDPLPLDNGNGLTGKFFSGAQDSSNPVDSTRIAQGIDFIWPNYQPPSAFKAEWSGWITPPHDGYFLLELLSNGTTRINISEGVVSLSNNDGVENETPIYMETTKYYALDVSYTPPSSTDTVKLVWTSNLLPKSTIPKNQLFSSLNLYDHIVKVYPNPFSDALFVNLEKLATEYPVQLILLDIYGRQVFKTEAFNRTIKVSTTELSKGTYLLIIETKGNKYLVKIFK